MHEPLSQRLAKILASSPDGSALTLNQILERTEGRGIYLVVMLLSLPFIVPVSIPGFSTVLGLAIVVIALRLAVGKPARLPRFMGERQLPPAVEKKVIVGSMKFLRFIEKLVKPRKTLWLTSRYARFGHGLLLTFLGLLLALPFPPFPPFTNSLPTYSIILVAASMMEEDGVTIWVGYVVTLGTVIYLAFVVQGLEYIVLKAYHALVQFLQK
jgi:hypothetical protein